MFRSKYTRRRLKFGLHLWQYGLHLTRLYFRQRVKREETEKYERLKAQMTPEELEASIDEFREEVLRSDEDEW